MYAEVVTEAGVNLVRRDEAFCLTESGWCSKKFFHTVLMYSWHTKFFCLKQCLLLKERKMLYSSFNTGNFFFPSSYHICDQFLWTCPQKNICIDYCFWKKDLEIKAERRRNYWLQKVVVFQKTFWTSPRKTGNFEGIVYFLCLVNEISRKSFPINGSKVHPLKRNIKDRERICFLFVDWANWKFFFCGKNVLCLMCFFMPLKERF